MCVLCGARKSLGNGNRMSSILVAFFHLFRCHQQSKKSHSFSSKRNNPFASSRFNFVIRFFSLFLLIFSFSLELFRRRASFGLKWIFFFASLAFVQFTIFGLNLSLAFHQLICFWCPLFGVFCDDKSFWSLLRSAHFLRPSKRLNHHFVLVERKKKTKSFFGFVATARKSDANDIQIKRMKRNTRSAPNTISDSSTFNRLNCFLHLRFSFGSNIFLSARHSCHWTIGACTLLWPTKLYTQAIRANVVNRQKMSFASFHVCSHGICRFDTEKTYVLRHRCLTVPLWCKSTKLDMRLECRKCVHSHFARVCYMNGSDANAHTRCMSLSWLVNQRRQFQRIFVSTLRWHEHLIDDSMLYYRINWADRI